LTFGSKSSPRVFTRRAYLSVFIARSLTSYPARLVVMHLDDLCSFGAWRTGRLGQFYNTYKEICGQLGISLMEEEAGDKSFRPTTTGICLGILFDTIRWMWTLSTDKIARYWNDILDLCDKEEAEAREVKSVVGKILYVAREQILYQRDHQTPKISHRMLRKLSRYIRR
jgi:hypothetical protein